VVTPISTDRVMTQSARMRMFAPAGCESLSTDTTGSQHRHHTAVAQGYSTAAPAIQDTICTATSCQRIGSRRVAAGGASLGNAGRWSALGAEGLHRRHFTCGVDGVRACSPGGDSSEPAGSTHNAEVPVPCSQDTHFCPGAGPRPAPPIETRTCDHGVPPASAVMPAERVGPTRPVRSTSVLNGAVTGVGPCPPSRGQGSAIRRWAQGARRTGGQDGDVPRAAPELVDECRYVRQGDDAGSPDGAAHWRLHAGPVPTWPRRCRRR
jgi:hypothetical protein